MVLKRGITVGADVMVVARYVRDLERVLMKKEKKKVGDLTKCVNYV
jgi:hypothetical protein